MTFAVNDGHNIWYEINGSGTPLVLIGGFALLHDQFEFSLPFLHKFGYSTINWNYRGSGKSDWTLVRPYSLEDWVEDLRSVLDHANIDKVNIWATSTSSVVGIRFAAKYPERVNKLITYPWLKADQYWKKLFDSAYGICEMFGIRAMSRIFAGSVMPLSMQYTKEQIDYEKWSGEKYENNLNMTTLRSTLDALSNVDLSGDVSNLKTTTYLLLGNDSALNQMKIKEAAHFDHLTKEFMKLNNKAIIRQVEGAGSTYCMISKPEETVLDVTKCIDE